MSSENAEPRCSCGGILDHADQCTECGGFVGVAAFDLENRELCRDGNCVGVIGADGHCRVCQTPGQLNVANPREQGLRDPAVAAQELEAHTVATATPGPEDFSHRELCPDGNCIGVIGPDGRCKECGTSV